MKEVDKDQEKEERLLRAFQKKNNLSEETVERLRTSRQTPFGPVLPEEECARLRKEAVRELLNRSDSFQPLLTERGYQNLNEPINF